jgi:hypothetical protein
MKKLLLVTVLSLVTTFAFAQRKPGKKVNEKAKANTSKDRKTTGKEFQKKTSQRRKANPTAKSSDVVTLAEAHYVNTKSSRDAVKEISAKATKGLESNKQVLVETYLTYLAELHGSKTEFDVMSPELVNEAIEQWGNVEVTNLTKIFEQATVKIKAKNVARVDVNKEFRDLLKELGIEEQFKKYCS